MDAYIRLKVLHIAKSRRTIERIEDNVNIAFQRQVQLATADTDTRISPPFT